MIKSRKGSNQYATKIKISWGYILIFSLYFIAVFCMGYAAEHKQKVISPLPDPVYAWNEPTPTPKKYSIDEMIDIQCNKYEKTDGRINRCKAMMHFLAYREAGYGSNKSCGDGGLACGIMQFHEATYKSYRKIMIKLGHVSHEGSRWNEYDAIETTAWSISTGREKAWGPILRGEISL